MSSRWPLVPPTGLTVLAAVIASTLTLGCSTGEEPPATPAEAAAFLDTVNRTMTELGVANQQAGWVAVNFITPDTQAISARASRQYVDAVARFAKDATRFDGVELPPDQRRQLTLLSTSLVMAAPADPQGAEEVTTIAARLEAAYGQGKWCPDPSKADSCLNIDAAARVLATARDPERLRQTWEGWQTIAAPMRKDYTRFVTLANQGARELGFADTGAMWRSKYDMPPEEFTKEVDRLWGQVRPLYLKLHAYVRFKLREKYGDVVPVTGPIPAYLLGNLWAQDWGHIYSLVAPPHGDAGTAVADALKRHKLTPVELVRFGEGFYTSLGFNPLPATFWQRSLFVRPRDRDVVCHASAWDVDLDTDLRIKMCIEGTDEDFSTIHHELGHSFYQRAYRTQPVLFRDSAHDGFHEAVGDTIALSVTPDYLVKIGLLDKSPDAAGDIGLLLARALDKVAFLPFGLLVDQWRWRVFAGEIRPEEYNKAWWDLRLKYQGVAPPSPRGEEWFDAGAKYHVPGNTPYTRYFLADILEFQFHRALARTAGCTLPLHRCSIFASNEAGKHLAAMLALGQSRPWPDALETLTGTRQMDATAMRDYFAPLSVWLDEQLLGKPVGW
ncbi:MAG: M2 family metallopeptidase [Acidobacteriota bacterium]